MKRKRLFLASILVLSIVGVLHWKIDRQVRIYCMVLTSTKFFQTRTRAVYETWGSRCDRLIFISDSSNDSTTNLPIVSIGKSREGYEHLSSKSIAGFEYIYQHEFDRFDWFVKTDDDTYVIIDNLRKFLQDKDPSYPVSYGYNFRVGYQSGGSGYVLSRESLRRLHRGIDEKNTYCQMNKFTQSEDMFIGDCLSSQGVDRGKSMDDLHRHRFHPLPLIDHIHGNFPQWFKDFSEDRQLKKGFDCCSDTSIAFHYVNPDLMYLIDVFLYKFRIKT